MTPPSATALVSDSAKNLLILAGGGGFGPLFFNKHLFSALMT